MADYVHKDYIGRASSLSNAITTVASISVSTGLFQVASHLPDQALIYYASSGIMFLIAFIIFAGIKDVDVIKQAAMAD